MGCRIPEEREIGAGYGSTLAIARMASLQRARRILAMVPRSLCVVRVTGYRVWMWVGACARCAVTYMWLVAVSYTHLTLPATPYV